MFSLLTLVATIAMIVSFKPGGPAFQFTQTYQWIPQFGIHYAVGVDGIGLVLIGMTAVLMPVVVLASWNDADPRPAAAAAGRNGAAPAASAGGVPPRYSVKTYFVWMLLLEAMVIGLFAATDVFLFYVLFEAMLIPMYFMIGGYGVGQRQYAAVKFLLYSLLGGLLMLAAVIALYVYSARGGHPGTFLFSQLIHVAFSPQAQKWLFLGFFIAFAIKAPLWPFHTWLPDAATSAQPGAAVLLVGVLDKVGTFGMIRYCLQLFPAAAHYYTPLVIVLALVGVLYGAIVAIGQRDIKRLIAYTSVSHFGLIALGIFVLHQPGAVGRDALHGEPRVLHRRAVPHRRLHDRPAAVAHDQRLRRGPVGRAGARRAVPDLRPGRPVAAGPVHLRQRVPGPGGHVHQVQGGRGGGDARHRPGRHLHPVDVPAHHDRAGAGADQEHARPQGQGTVGGRAADRADHLLRRSTRSRC